MNSELKRLGDIVRERRNAKGLTQQQLADKVGASKGTIANLELGKAQVDPATIARVGRILDLDLNGPTAVATVQVIAQAVEAIRSELIRRAEQMDTAQQVVYFGAVMNYVNSWEPANGISNGASNGANGN